jgi:hypothetical protein
MVAQENLAKSVSTPSKKSAILDEELIFVGIVKNN